MPDEALINVLKDDANDSKAITSSSTGLSKGVGFIRFDQRTEAERAIQALNGTTPKQCSEPITVKFANNPSNNINKAIPPLAAYLAPAAAAANLRRFPTGPIHHIGGRFRYSPLTGDLSSTVLSANAINGSGLSRIYKLINAKYSLNPIPFSSFLRLVYFCL